jgi:aminoglycoside phosphotransferase (APT) family kinase protein
MSNRSGRHIEVLRVVDQHIGALAGQVPLPQIGEALGYLGDLVGYAVATTERDARIATHRPALDALCEQAELLVEEHAIDAPAHADRPTRALVGLTMASAEGVPGADDLHRDLLALVATIEQLPPEGQSAVGEPTATPERPLEERLTDYLRHHTRDDGLTAGAVRQISGGFSKITTLVTYTTGAEAQAIALRQVPPGVQDDTLVPEYDVIRHVWAPGLPVPEPLWIEPEANDLGGPFFASRQAGGENLGTVGGATKDVPESVCLQLAEFLAALHSRDVEGLGRTPVPSMRTSQDIERAIVREEEDSLGRALEPHPLLADMFAWLRAHAPDGAERPVIVHGDLGFHNLLVQDGRLTAVLDWERAHVGDAMEDLMYLRPSIEPVFSWSRFLERYAECGGHVVEDPALERFYDTWKEVWRCAQCVKIGTDFDQGDTRLPAAIAGCLLAPRFLTAALRAAYGSAVPVAG